MRLSLLLVLVIAACGSSPDRAGSGVDAFVDTSTWPAWQLEDVQPTSPRAGETYGLDAFAGKIVVMSLLQGF